MKRLKLFLLIVTMLLMAAAVVVLRSPYAPVVGGPVEIEELWAIEDTRVESEKPLVTALENHGVPLAYDREYNTFYCSLGRGNTTEWPDLHLTVTGGGGEHMFSSRMIIPMIGAATQLLKVTLMS